MSVIIDMDKPEYCEVCPLCNGVKCAQHDEWYDNWPEEYAHCPLRPAPERERWIPVAERLPDGIALAVNALRGSYGYHEQLIGYIGADAKSDSGYSCESEDKILMSVTHWMPLPKPPEEEEECP